MEIQRQNGTLSVQGLRDLNQTNANVFRSQINGALTGDLKCIEIDLSQINFVDSGGVATLVAIHQDANAQNQNGGVVLRLLNPQPPVQQMFELTRIQQLFEIVGEDLPPK